MTESQGRLRVAFITEFSEIGGGEKNLYDLCRELHKTVQVTVFCPNGKLAEMLREAKIPTEELAYWPRKRWIRGLPIPGSSRNLRTRLNDFDIIHAYSLNVLPLLFGISTPVVWTIHGYWERPVGWRAKVINKFVKTIVVISNEIMGLAEFPTNKKIFIPLGTKLAQFIPQHVSFEKPELTITCVGRFQKIKGQDILIQAAKRTSETLNRKIIINFVGGVNENSKINREFYNSIVEHANKSSNKNLSINFTGYKRDPKQIMVDSDIIVVPSRYESFSIVTIEALSLGKPVIAPNIGGPKEIINDGTVGLLFAPGDGNDLSKKLVKLINRGSFDPGRARERAEIFSVERQSDSHLSLYRNLLGKLL